MLGLMRRARNTTDRWMVWTLSDVADLAQRVESTLRNQGHPVRVAWMADIEELERSLQRQSPHVLLVDSALEASVLTAVIAHRDRWAPDTPIIHWASEYTHQRAEAALRQGASTLVASGSPEALGHLELEIILQLQHHLHLRELRRLRSRLQQYERRHTLLAAETQDAIVRIQEGIVVEFNRATQRILGAADDNDLIGSPLMNLIIADEHARVKEHFKRLYRSMGRWDAADAVLECTLLTADEAKPMRFEIRTSEFDGAPCLDLIVRASAASAVAPDTASVTSGREALTDALERLQANDRPALMMLAVDRFEGLETQLGYLAVDALMEAVEEWVLGHLGKGDVLFRTGTSEWMGLLRSPALHHLADWLDQLVTAGSRQLFQSSRHETHLVLKVGAYALDDQDRYNTALTALVSGVRALPTAAGRLSHVFGEKADAAVAQRSLEQRAQHLKTSLDNDAMHLVFQPITSLQGDATHPHDVLVRLMDPNGIEQSGSWFIEAARQFQLVTQLDRWVTGRVLALQRKRENTGTPPLIIKLGEQTVRDAEAYLAWLTPQLEGRHIESGKIIFSLRESEIEKHIRKAIVLSRGLRAMGADLLIEHFGLSSHALKLLDHLPVQYVKLAPSFTVQSESGERLDRLKNIIEAIHQRNVKSIVSHVENAQTMARLWQLGVNFIQGYGVQEPEVVLMSS
jgi:multidomain signaling protein FimX